MAIPELHSCSQKWGGPCNSPSSGFHCHAAAENGAALPRPQLLLLNQIRKASAHNNKSPTYYSNNKNITIRNPSHPSGHRLIHLSLPPPWSMVPESDWDWVDAGVKEHIIINILLVCQSFVVLWVHVHVPSSVCLRVRIPRGEKTRWKLIGD